MKGKILVTGGTGFIGSHTAVELINEGYEVVIIDDLSNSTTDVLDGIEKITGTKPSFHQFNICDEHQLKAFFEKEKDIDAIIHFAASKAVGESVEKPILYYRNNIGSLVNLLEEMNNVGVKHMVFSSSCTVYGQPEKLPVTEQTPVQPAESPYGNTKQICEEILQDTTKAHGNLNTIALRYFNPVGAHETAHIGELPNGVPANLVPFITQTAAGLREQISVFGSDYNTPDGTAIRDYIHVVDLAKAHVIAVSRMVEGKNKANYECFNIGTGTGYSVLETVKKFEEVNGVNLNYKIVDRRPGDIEQIYADTTYANEELGWKAELGLEEMMRSAWKWQLRVVGKD
ncbi:UDP-glucose 4-epimerase GalE [Marinoscillum furvescens]|uniref:UDP-glucose 4-epimerase n=1 Tax=Marinoscillum furvescens DSM 4134 TaxID=1122208 RepID=A0A3D9KXR3_MARFU|nr:UDP-glucose 4-epimerase GalE [Marinoscillum furvescens]RED93885.1 UDP-glucose 4-epimerase [Marinoscillum furvescens DSM 4134]